MKKFLTLIAAVMVFGVSLAKAETVLVPAGRGANILQTDAYGGVLVATSSFSAGVATACVTNSSTSPFCTGVFSGIYISSDAGTSFVDIYDSTTAAIVPNDAQFLFRVYTATVTTGQSTGATAGTWNWMQHPARFSNGLVFKPSVATLNKVSVFYWKRQ